MTDPFATAAWDRYLRAIRVYAMERTPEALDEALDAYADWLPEYLPEKDHYDIPRSVARLAANLRRADGGTRRAA